MSSTIASPVNEVRFAFGKNWGKFAHLVDEERISAAERSLTQFLPCSDFKGKRFLDIGCGSGLMSLAAIRLGAEVHAFDYDPDAVSCTRQLKNKYGGDRDLWTIEQGSVLDRDYIRSLGEFDIVYSWGVLHHTGAMWQAVENAQLAVKPGGYLYIALYNDQGGASRRWASVKKLYNTSSKVTQFGIVLAVGAFFETRAALIRLARFQNPLPLQQWAMKKNQERGMSVWHDLVDWVGGYPFEVAKPEEVFEFLQSRSFALTKLRTCAGGLGCNEFVFRKEPRF